MVVHQNGEGRTGPGTSDPQGSAGVADIVPVRPPSSSNDGPSAECRAGSAEALATAPTVAESEREVVSRLRRACKSSEFRTRLKSLVALGIDEMRDLVDDEYQKEADEGYCAEDHLTDLAVAYLGTYRVAVCAARVVREMEAYRDWAITVAPWLMGLERGVFGERMALELFGGFSLGSECASTQTEGVFGKMAGEGEPLDVTPPPPICVVEAGAQTCVSAVDVGVQVDVEESRARGDGVSLISPPVLGKVKAEGSSSGEGFLPRRTDTTPRRRRKKGVRWEDPPASPIQEKSVPVGLGGGVTSTPRGGDTGSATEEMIASTPDSGWRSVGSSSGGESGGPDGGPGCSSPGGDPTYAEVLRGDSVSDSPPQLVVGGWRISLSTGGALMVDPPRRRRKREEHGGGRAASDECGPPTVPPPMTRRCLAEDLERRGCRASGGVDLPEIRRLRCFRCLEAGHIALWCDGPDRRGRCYVCSAPSHRAARCPARAVRCPLCADLCRPSGHVLGAVGCSLPCKWRGRAPKKKRAPLSRRRGESTSSDFEEEEKGVGVRPRPSVEVSSESEGAVSFSPATPPTAAKRRVAVGSGGGGEPPRAAQRRPAEERAGRGRMASPRGGTPPDSGGPSRPGNAGGVGVKAAPRRRVPLDVGGTLPELAAGMGGSESHGGGGASFSPATPLALAGRGGTGKGPPPEGEELQRAAEMRRPEDAKVRPGRGMTAPAEGPSRGRGEVQPPLPKREKPGRFWAVRGQEGGGGGSSD